MPWGWHYGDWWMMGIGMLVWLVLLGLAVWLFVRATGRASSTARRGG